MSREAELRKSAQAFFSTKTPFPISLAGFAAFPPRVVYVHVELSERLEQLFKSTQEWGANEIHSLDRPDERTYKPHVTIAFRDLTRQLFARIWQKYEKEEFRADYVQSAATLLRHTGKQWEILSSHQFSR